MVKYATTFFCSKWRSLLDEKPNICKIQRTKSCFHPPPLLHPSLLLLLDLLLLLLLHLLLLCFHLPLFLLLHIFRYSWRFNYSFILLQTYLLHIFLAIINVTNCIYECAVASFSSYLFCIFKENTDLNKGYIKKKIFFLSFFVCVSEAINRMKFFQSPIWDTPTGLFRIHVLFCVELPATCGTHSLSSSILFKTQKLRYSKNNKTQQQQNWRHLKTQPANYISTLISLFPLHGCKNPAGRIHHPAGIKHHNVAISIGVTTMEPSPSKWRHVN